LRRAFVLDRNDIATLAEAMYLDPNWLFFDYGIEVVSDKKAILRVTKCLAQLGRLRSGKSIFACRPVDEAYHVGFAREFNPNIKVRCHFPPPEQYSGNFWCEWEFTIG
jgi:hypothetical protein